MTEILTGKERELLAQLIDARRREEMLLDEISRLENRNKDANLVRKQLRHALKELDSMMKRSNPMLSNEEWEIVRAMRGHC